MMLIRTALLSLCVAALSGPAFAALGGDGTSIGSDLAKMKGSLRVNTTADYTVHEITTSYGTVVREYVSSADKVFAVSWRGPIIPDLRQVLGGYYAQYLQATGAPHAGGHRHLSIEQPNLVVQSSGHMRAFAGRAWAPDLLPKDFSTGDIH